MLELAFVVLVLGALIAIIFGRKIAKKFIEGVVIGICVLVGAAIYIVWKSNQHATPLLPPQYTYTPTGGGTVGYGNKTFGFTSEIASPTTCASYGITYTGGSLWVESVVSGSSAQRAKLPTGIIVEVDGHAPDSQELTAVKARHNVGDWIPFKIVTPDRRWWNYWVQLGST